jgi:N-acetylmuramoyl-L-alanine amidase
VFPEKRIRVTHKVHLLVAAIAALCLTCIGFAEEEPLLLKDKSGTSRTVELVRLERTLYLPMRALVEVLAKADPHYRVEFDTKTGILRVKKGDLTATLFLSDAKVLAGDSLVKCDAPLRAYQGEVLVPLGSFEVINRYFGEFEPVNPPAEKKRLEEIASEETTVTPESVATLGATEEAAPDVGQVEIPQEAKIETPERLKEALAEEAKPRLGEVVLDPGGTDAALPGTLDKAEAAQTTLQIAKRVKELLEGSGEIHVAVTQESAANLDLEERVRRINTSGAQVLVSLRLDSSEFSNLRGIQIYCVNEAVDWEGRQYQGDAKSDPTLSPHLLYLRHQYHSLVLASFVKRELKRAVPVQIWQVKLAPIYLLKRANMPSVLIVLGYASNKEDMNLLQDASYVEAVSRAVAGAILSYQRYLEHAEMETKSP